jgi:DeoR/GlpR family transcriptional regulator of sugar metabolism
MDERGGFTTPNLLEAETNRALVRSARRLVVVADHTKWGIVGLSTIAALGEADVLVTDDALAPEARAALSEHVGELIVAGRGA